MDEETVTAIGVAVGKAVAEHLANAGESSGPEPHSVEALQKALGKAGEAGIDAQEVYDHWRTLQPTGEPKGDDAKAEEGEAKLTTVESLFRTASERSPMMSTNGDKGADKVDIMGDHAERHKVLSQMFQ